MGGCPFTYLDCAKHKNKKKKKNGTPCCMYTRMYIHTYVYTYIYMATQKIPSPSRSPGSAMQCSAAAAAAAAAAVGHCRRKCHQLPIPFSSCTSAASLTSWGSTGRIWSQGTH